MPVQHGAPGELVTVDQWPRSGADLTQCSEWNMRHPVLWYCDNEALFTQDIEEKLLIAQLCGAKFFNHQDVDIYELFDDSSLLFHIRLQRDCFLCNFIRCCVNKDCQHFITENNLWLKLILLVNNLEQLCLMLIQHNFRFSTCQDKSGCLSQVFEAFKNISF